MGSRARRQIRTAARGRGGDRARGPRDTPNPHGLGPRPGRRLERRGNDASDALSWSCECRESAKCESGEIGRRTRLRIWRGNPWGFESPLSHQQLRISSEEHLLKREFCRSLQKPRRRSLYHLAEQGAGNITVNSRRPEELRVIEDVERLHPKLQ